MEKLKNFVQLKKNYIETHDEGGNVIGDPIFVWTPIRRVDNVIYFSADVDEYSQMVLTQYLQDAQSDLIIDNARGYGSEESHIKIIMNSPGGYLHCGFALYDIIKNMKMPVEVEVQGFCASAASLILLAAHRRSMTTNSTVLLHQLSTGVCGTYQNIIDVAKNSEMAMNMLRELYLRETLIGYTQEEVAKIRLMQSCEEYQEFAKNEEIVQRRIKALNDLLSHDLELSKFDCERFGIIDKPHSVTLDEKDVEQINKLTEELVNKKLDEMIREENKDFLPKKKGTQTKKTTPFKKKKETSK